ncbi:hypothetical protein [Fuerstiella marisgermanici]|uniref:Uncharacterized protein n=1 Tax=Fuerstiella marisgermanici TaxID=1891926 RepID=A0A1P8WF52_9PLAN|nr:hypothetical protein [Fuerstiella marisgermanici]APZ92669.1 hypothetical protein Fuma_02280 [Fuerstiella marisgermanici]
MFRSICCVALSLTLIISPAVSFAADAFDFSRFFRRRPATDSAVIQLAKTLDDIEKKLNADGTVAVKAPDIWGEARLTRHREEFEREMAKELDQFEFRINAAISRTDQAFLANALAISAVGSGVDLSDGNPTNVPNLNVNQASNLVDGLPQQTRPGGEITKPTNQVLYVTPTHGLLDGDFKVKAKGISIEPEILLDQKARYLNHLHEIRRMNEGDDTSDSPGYSMNLVRIPVSIMPGSKTRRNHGAEVTITATPHVTEELLPVTFRQLVINDLLDLLSPVVRKMAEELPQLEIPLTSQGQSNVVLSRFLEGEDGALVRLYYGEHGIANGYAVNRGQQEELTRAQDAREMAAGLPFTPPNIRAVESQALSSVQSNPARLQQAISTLGREIYSVAPQLLQTGVGSVTRRAREPLSSSQIPFTFGVHELVSLAYDLRQRSAPGQIIHLADVRSYLQEELQAAFDLAVTPGSSAALMMSDPGMMLADEYSGQSLPARIRNMTHENIRSLFDDRVRITNEFARVLKVHTSPDASVEMYVPSVTTSLAWAVVVEAALLNERLNEDIRHVSSDPNCQCVNSGEMLFCAPNPDPQARQVFADYVRCRWPIHVFALDPIAQDQNVADSFSMRREMQLAMALAFAQGRMSAQNMTRYVRRIEMDMETIALNRTAAAFGHGKDVFGWRFYPRVQTPPFSSTSTTIFRELLRGGPDKDDLRRSWEIEPGMRECTAMVLMPSFITHVTFDARGSYFPLGKHALRDPSDTRTSIQDNMYLSHKIRLMENATCSIAAEAACYRDGEVQRLMRRADQLAKKLPLQTVHARVPNENTLGGFEMFSSGITDLAPELLDFYGMPGVDPARETILYLVGNNFSVHDTRVLAGNRQLHFSLISRQVMQVTIPAGVAVVDSFQCNRKERCEQPEHVVNVHVATPYGVSQPLEIPVVTDSASSSAFLWTRENLQVGYRVGLKSGSNDTELDPAQATAFMPRPFTIGVAVPDGEFPQPASATLTLVLTSQDLGLTTKVQEPTGSNVEGLTLTWNEAARAYELSEVGFVKLQKDLMKESIGWINAEDAGNAKVSRDYEVRIRAELKMGNLASVPVANDLYLNIRLEVQKP